MGYKDISNMWTRQQRHDGAMGILPSGPDKHDLLGFPGVDAEHSSFYLREVFLHDDNRTTICASLAQHIYNFEGHMDTLVNMLVEDADKLNLELDRRPFLRTAIANVLDDKGFGQLIWGQRPKAWGPSQSELHVMRPRWRVETRSRGIKNDKDSIRYNLQCWTAARIQEKINAPDQEREGESSKPRLCPISCPTGLPPTHGNEPLRQQLSGIASAKEVNILFDFKWVHQERRGTFWQIVRRPQDLSGISADLRTLYQPREWLAAFQSVKKVASEPSLSLSAASKKRSRQASPTPNSPGKRTSSDRARVSSTGATGSPAESCVAASNVVDVTPEHAPFHPRGRYINEIISKENRKLLPQALRDALPSELVTLLSVPTKTSPTAPHHDFSGLVHAQAASFLRKFQDETHDQVERLRSTAVEEFNEVLKDRTHDVDITRDDHMTELDRVFAEKVTEFKNRAEEIADEVHDRAYNHFAARLQWLIREETARAFERRALEFGRRAASLPF
ncbi:hypothetical protein BKA63DRAFT_573068 [Paraphoma chrysanthemicola]|nr:hypothetical protein BKA63DRAFT_573068 [Paraphoma chrysanthemicola]